ncbi:hypothetical protein PGT21_013091 [Puccinia graminis f. sp. tritici]|uniref:CxC1-like cysteine cluster associated with KDZ transposases domain-containing protein n=1 Tax=Puccinia graminis f. sp. tritici TaxID=56615 RepID=A0A5B0R0V8_PUCGR|nr:hypothetical protein PGT21_013091 [Puccinia graminis f. sp. tritici]
MIQKLKTDNWACENAYESFVKCSCVNQSNHKVDLIEIYGQKQSDVAFCPCTPDVIRLLQQGYVAGSPVRPQTAFSLPLLIFHNHLWNNCHVGTLPFTLALTEWLEPQSQRLFAKNKNHAWDVQKPFSACIYSYENEESNPSLYILSSLFWTRARKLR